MSVLNISAIDFTDLDQLAALYDELAGIQTARHMLRRLFRKVRSDRNYVLLGARDAEHNLIGSVTGIVCTDLVGRCRPFMVIDNVIVSEKFRGQGIGKHMIRCIERHARERHCGFTVLTAARLTECTADGFYEAIGYRPNTMGFKKYL